MKIIDGSVRGAPLRRPAAALAFSCVLAVGGTLAGCADSTPDPATNAAASAVETRPAPAAGDPAARTQTLRAAASRHWTAKQAEDWPTVFTGLDPIVRANSSVEYFSEWSAANEPFVVHDYTLDDVAVEQDYGWVHVTMTSSMRKYPAVPPRETARWDKWRLVDDAWYPVPGKELEFYPAAPAERDLAAEKTLRERAESSWAARRDEEWERLYEMVDPADRPFIAEGQFIDNQMLTRYLSHRIHWVEAINDRGVVRVEVKQKLTDPSLTKLPPDHIIINEKWIQSGGVWYIDNIGAQE